MSPEAVKYMMGTFHRSVQVGKYTSKASSSCVRQLGRHGVMAAFDIHMSKTHSSHCQSLLRDLLDLELPALALFLDNYSLSYLLFILNCNKFFLHCFYPAFHHLRASETFLGVLGISEDLTLRMRHCESSRVWFDSVFYLSYGISLHYHSEEDLFFMLSTRRDRFNLSSINCLKISLDYYYQSLTRLSLTWILVYEDGCFGKYVFFLASFQKYLLVLVASNVEDVEEESPSGYAALLGIASSIDCFCPKSGRNLDDHAHSGKRLVSLWEPGLHRLGYALWTLVTVTI
ncbi:hypothetical protein Tco_0548637 [Tanacetum coccineum]